MIYLKLALEFFKTGLFAIGGGLATLPFLREISLTHPEWYSLKELSNMVAIANATPGPIGVNMATYAGFSTGGVLGSVVATLSLALPSFIIILIVSKVLDKFKNSIYVEGTFTGLRPAVVALISIALIQLARESFVNIDFQNIFEMFNFKHIAFFVVLFVFTRIHKKDHTVLYILLGAVAGIIFKM